MYRTTWTKIAPLLYYLVDEGYFTLAKYLIEEYQCDVNAKCISRSRKSTNYDDEVTIVTTEQSVLARAAERASRLDFVNYLVQKGAKLDLETLIALTKFPIDNEIGRIFSSENIDMVGGTNKISEYFRCSIFGQVIANKNIVLFKQLERIADWRVPHHKVSHQVKILKEC